MIHLAAQAGVRYSLENPIAYVRVERRSASPTSSRPAGTAATPHLTYASTSSVYGGNTTMPFAEGQGVDHPLQFYAATKRANELMAHAYSHLYRLPTHRPALLHRLRPLGPARHGADALRRAPSPRAGRSGSSTRAGTAATSPTSTTSSRG